MEDKIRRRDAERLTVESTILSSLEKLQENLVKLQKHSQNKSEIITNLENKQKEAESSFVEFKTIIQDYFLIEHNFIKVCIFIFVGG